MKQLTWKSLLKAIPLVLFILAFVFLYRSFRHFRAADLLVAVSALGLFKILMAVVLTQFNQVIFALYDRVGLKQFHVKIPFWDQLRASYYSCSVSQVVGQPLLTGIALKFKYYEKYSLSLRVIAHISFFNGIYYWGGICGLMGGALTILGQESELPYLTSGWTRTAGIVIFVLPFLAVLLAQQMKDLTIVLLKETLKFPRPGTLAKGFFLATMELCSYSLVLYLLLPTIENFSFYKFVPLFLISQVLGGISQVPAGVGVQEVAFISFFKEELSSQILISLLLFRIIYYVLPFVVTAVCLGTRSLKRALSKGSQEPDERSIRASRLAE